MAKKIALITGANKGLGFETALQLGHSSYVVLIGSRDEEKGLAAVEKLKEREIDAQHILIDPTDAKSIQSAVKTIESKFGVLDVLINNAGTMLDGDAMAPSEVSTQVFRDTFEINVFGLHEVTKAFWPLLNKSKAARLVNISSALGSLSMHDQKSFGDFRVIAYDASKAAVNMMTIHYAAQWEGTPHKANCVHPGSVKTDLNPNGELTVEVGAKSGVDLAMIGPDGPNGKFYHLTMEIPW